MLKDVREVAETVTPKDMVGVCMFLFGLFFFLSQIYVLIRG
jgi:hypothetical protein